MASISSAVCPRSIKTCTESREEEVLTHKKQVYMQDSGIFSQVGVGSLLIDCSTIDPEVARDVARISREKGVRFVDAPVSGGTIGAQNATLTFMVGALAKDFEEASQVLQLMGKNVLHCGEPGNGQVAKLCNNLILGITMAGVSEAFNLGKRMGMDPKVLADVVNCSSGRSWSSDTYNPCPGVMEGVPSARGHLAPRGSHSTGTTHLIP